MKIVKRSLRFAVIVVTGVLLLITAALMLSRYLEKEVKKELHALNIQTSQISINFLNRTITAENVCWMTAPAGSSYPGDSVQITKVRLSGIDLYQAFFNKNIRLRKVSLTDGYVRYSRNRTKTGPSEGKTPPLKSLTINSIELSNITSEIFSDTIREYSGTVNLFLRDIRLTDANKIRVLEAYSINSFETSITHLTLAGKEWMYNVKIARLYASSSEDNVKVDSIFLIPRYSKYRFSRKKGRQMDRITLSIPRLSVSGFDFGLVKDSTYRAIMVEIDNPKLHVYRDKRLPFIKHDVTPLPVAMIRSLPFEMSIDTIKINQGRITYEEFPEKGFNTGYVSFDNLNATIDHVSNRDFYNEYKKSTIYVTSKIMGKGTIAAEFSLPYGKEQIYNAKGVIKNLALHRLNPILENAAFISIESGILNQLNFNFDYDEYNSNGSVLINYEDLKIKSLTKEEDSSPNEFKSWVLNTFLKNNKDKSVSRDKRTGIIQFERERNRAIFNLWVKSLFSGLKSSVMDSPGKKKKI